MTMMLSFAALMRHLPGSLVARLDGWSRRVAQTRVDARRQRSWRKTQPLPPVLNGRAYLPHPWRD
jgi:hypothetical protein